MPGKVKLEIVQGVMKSKLFEFKEHDTFVLGRTPDCHVCLPDDPMVSRHQFILEVNPPDARLRDLGSLNGTFVNGTKHGGRQENETPEEGAKRKYPEVDLKDGDSIAVGETVFKVCVETSVFCCECGTEIADPAREKYVWVGGTFICFTCKQKAIVAVNPPKEPEPVRCQKCGKDVSKEVGGVKRQNYICVSCRAGAENDPIKLLMQILQKERIKQGPAVLPKIEGYEVGRKLGQGAMGAVYEAYRKTDREHVAVKILLSRIAVNERARKTFDREIYILRQLKHKNIVSYIDDGSSGEVFYFIQEFCEGGSLDKLILQHGRKVPLNIAGPIMLQVLEGLAYAHQAEIEVIKSDGSKIKGKGIVHRDLKPQNILLAGTANNWKLKIADYGLAKCFDTAGLSSHTLTGPGQTGGTPPFMPKEQVTNYKYVKPVSDVWSIAATFYNMLTGAFPRDFRPGQDPIAMVLNGIIIPIRKRDASIPVKLAEVIDKALAVDVKDRYQDAGEMLKAMQKIL
jgi:hypothetical protein